MMYEVEYLVTSSEWRVVELEAASEEEAIRLVEEYETDDEDSIFVDSREYSRRNVVVL